MTDKEIDKYEDAVPFHSKNRCEETFCCCRWCKDKCVCMQWYRDREKEKKDKANEIKEQIKLSELETGFLFTKTDLGKNNERR